VNALVLNGALRGDDGLTPIEQAISGALSLRGWSVERVHLRDLTIAYCQGCFDCWVKTPGVCKTKDAAGDVTRAIVRSDLLVLLSPVTLGGYSSELKKALDRSIGIVSPFFTRISGEVHHKKRYARYPSLLAVGVVREPDPEEQRIFSALVTRNAVNFHAPVHVTGFVPRAASPAVMRSSVAELVAMVTDHKRGAA
jgi:multimeric flavodoxin WrbA